MEKQDSLLIAATIFYFYFCRVDKRSGTCTSLTRFICNIGGCHFGVMCCSAPLSRSVTVHPKRPQTPPNSLRPRTQTKLQLFQFLLWIMCFPRGETCHGGTYRRLLEKRTAGVKLCVFKRAVRGIKTSEPFSSASEMTTWMLGCQVWTLNQFIIHLFYGCWYCIIFWKDAEEIYIVQKNTCYFH